ncbi:hypothetical protein [Bradyrhizobium sp. 187]|nr:hypothetical protein [Bradyrhizobium sp. 187]UPJ76836.1 hypothetical protein IVB19_38810 [Bradyrhizobium sp. 187]
MTTAKPPARYGAIWGRASGRLCSTELHLRIPIDVAQDSEMISPTIPI